LFSMLLHTLAHRPAFDKLAVEARAEFAPWLPDDAFERIADEAIRLKRKWKPDTLARRIGLTYADQQRLGVWRFIGAVDVPKAERTRLAAERKVEARRAKRRAAGVMPRDHYLTKVLSSTRPWEAEGISRRTWERRRAKACRKSDPLIKRDAPIGATLATPPRAAPPQGFRAGMRLGVAAVPSSSWPAI